MKKVYHYKLSDREIEREYRYIPFRYIWAVLITLLEVLAILAIVVALCYYVPYFYLAAWATEIACVITIIASEDNPDYKVPWLLFVMILPIAGFMLYFMFYSRKLQKRFIKRLEYLKHKAYVKNDEQEFSALKQQSEMAHSQAKMLCNIAETHLFTNTKQKYFPSGEAMHESLLQDLSRAERFIFMEYFIIEEGVFWNSILEILKEKARQGLEVRVVYDDVGCMATLPGNYDKMLSSYGIQAAPFSRLKGQADSEFNNRSHPKITVIDGFIAYTGGVNIADEYINHVQRFGHWKDVGLRLEGEAVKEMTKLFLIDYGINVKKIPENKTNYYAEKKSIEGEGYVIPFGDGPRPIYTRRVGKSVIQNLLASATKYVYIMTPYLIIDNELCQSIENTALRGVEVKLITPHIPDKKLVFEMTCAHYQRLMEAGVKIYEYTPGFIHAKCYLTDDEIAMVGTINLDYRSLVHHFENGVWMYKTECVAEIKKDMHETLQKCVCITTEMEKPNLLQRFFRSVAKIFAPLL